ncbi:MAG TPA: hypothetical protein DCE43_21695 [Planctomycetaceae bacterium]|nr:hypothetical protein [Planctomycetaceae bacterium]
MTRTLITLTLACLVALAPIGVRAADPPSDDSDVTTHEQLRELRTGLFNAFNKNDVDTLLTYCHPDIVVVWQDGSISEGHKGVAVKFKELDAFLDSMNCKPASDHLSVIYDGDVAIARGKLNDTYHLRRHGSNVALDSSWSATLVRQDDRWLLASFAASTSLYDNPVVHLFVQKAQYTTGLWAGLAGLVLGIGASLLIRRRSRPSTTEQQEAA